MTTERAQHTLNTLNAPVRLEHAIDALLARRSSDTGAYFAAEAPRIARVCHRMAERFAAGGRLLAIADGPAMLSDARHVAVEFVHPVIVGKRALPALVVNSDPMTLAGDVELLASRGDIVMAFGGGLLIRDAVAAARARGALTIAFANVGADRESIPPTDDPFVAQELVETLYHVLWELVHVFFEHRGLLGGVVDAASPVGAPLVRAPVVSTPGDGGAASFLYPFLADAERDLDAVLRDVERSIITKAADIVALRARMLDDRSNEGNRTALVSAATALRRVFDAGGALLAFGNGGSSTDAADAVADYLHPPRGWPRRAALDLSSDASILTAVANDIGADAMFARQLIAYGRPIDAALGFSTSGESRNVILAFAEARKRGMPTIAFVGYGGGRIRADRLADHVVAVPSEYVPRIQEAQATAHHVLRELVER